MDNLETQRSDGIPVTAAASAVHWRSWLAEHHDREKGVWLVIFKKDSGIDSVTYDEAVDQALAYGWVDSKPNKRDEISYYQYFSKRNPKSNWSRVNKEKIQRLESAGLLAEPGREMVRIAKETGTWTALDEVEQGVIPPDLATAFEAFPGSAEHFDAFPRSVKRGILEWILNAKRPETRARRIRETAALAMENKRANQYRK